MVILAVESDAAYTSLVTSLQK